MIEPAAQINRQAQCRLDAFRIVHQDAQLVAVHKPAALLVHRSPIDRHETRFALQMARDAVGQRVYPVHRLDKPTSGLLLFALDAESARAVAEQFARHEVRKTYHALVRGWPEQEGSIDRPLTEQLDAHGDADRSTAPSEQSAITHFRRLQTTTLDHAMGRYAQQRYALLELKPRTGRKHQLRRHMVHIRHPIIGDVNHGDRNHNHLFNDWRGYRRLYLAATQLCLQHPRSGERLELNAPLQSDFADTLRALGLHNPVPI